MAGITFLDQETQIRNASPVAQYGDAVAPTEAAYETNPTNLNDDMDNLRSQINNVINRAGAGFPATDWFGDLVAPTGIEAGSIRGINANNEAAHDLEVKRFLDCVWGLDSIAGGAGQGVSLGAGELPGNLIAAIGSSTELGSVVQTATVYGTYSATDVVAGVTAIGPYNLVQMVDAVTRDPLTDGADQIYGLLQCESAVDGSTMTTVAGNRVQISFVKISGGNSLALITAGAMTGKNFDYCYVEQNRFKDLTRGVLLGGAAIDVPTGTTVTRQVGYTNQGTTPVDLLTNATLDLEAAGIQWLIRDDLEASLFGVVEGSAGGTSQLNVYGDVDEFDVDAVVNDFANGATINSAGTRPIRIGVTDGVIDTTAGDLMVKAFVELLFDDANQTGSTWAQDGIKLSETTAEWDAYETAFGEVSLLNAIVQAKNTTGRRKVNSICTVAALPNVDVSGPATDNNLDTELGDLSAGVFVTATGDGDYDIFVNGDSQVLGVNLAAGKDVYPGTSLLLGQLKFAEKTKVGYVITVIDWVA
jgi:hypothetical protein